tara:strand:- start:55 stop:660 length:606 start_codon:yes stop_codon:yes gene_type:complete
MKPIFIKDFLPIQLFNFINSYCLIKYSNSNHMNLDQQTGSFIRNYADDVMETLMDLSTPVIESNVGKKLFPTYSYFRIYDKGDDLKTHTDREACEFTVALCLGADPVDKPYDIFVGERDDNSDYKYYNQKTNKLEGLNIEHKFNMVPNSAVVFKGQDKVHWREPSTHDHFITVFLHYVDQEGPHKDEKYDMRDKLGAKPTQ